MISWRLSILVIHNSRVLQRCLLKCLHLLLFTEPSMIHVVLGEGTPKENSCICIYAFPWNTKVAKKDGLNSKMDVSYPDASKGIFKQ